MYIKSSKVYAKFSFVLVTVQCLIGCVGFRGNKLPPVTTIIQIPADQKKPSVFFDVNTRRVFKGDGYRLGSTSEELPKRRDQFIEIVGNTTKEANLFRNYTFDQPKAQKMDYTIQLDMLHHMYSGLAQATSFCALPTLYILPAVGEDKYTLSAKVLDSKGKLLKRYILEDNMTTVAQVFLVFVSPFLYPEKVEREIISNMIKNLYQQILRDNIVTVLLEAGAGVNEKSYDGRTSLMEAARRGRTDVVQILLERGADVNVEEKDFGRTPLMLAANRGYTDIVQALLEAGADMNAVDYSGRTALLHTVLFWDVPDTVRVLLKAGADVNVKDNRYGLTALMYAAYRGYINTVKVLLEAGANPNIQATIFLDGSANNYTALGLAAKNGHNKTVKLLKQAGARE